MVMVEEWGKTTEALLTDISEEFDCYYLDLLFAILEAYPSVNLYSYLSDIIYRTEKMLTDDTARITVHTGSCQRH